jgi:hypothetical protein
MLDIFDPLLAESTPPTTVSTSYGIDEDAAGIEIAR